MARKSKKFIRRSKAAKKGWQTRRKNNPLKWGKKVVPKKRVRKKVPKQKITEIIQENIELKQQVEFLMGRFERVITLDHLPPRRINETQLEHASRIVSALKTQGIEADQGYKEVAEHTGMTLREIYTLFHYVGVGDFAAQ